MVVIPDFNSKAQSCSIDFPINLPFCLAGTAHAQF